MAKKFLFIVVLVIGAFVLAACGGSPEAGPDTAEVAAPAVPAEYAGKTNPLKGDAAAAAAGKTTYEQFCASCHGDTGKGDGPAGAALSPVPANLMVKGKVDADDFLFWRISEGGAMDPFNSSMPANKGVLTEEQIWQVITYIQTLK